MMVDHAKDSNLGKMRPFRRGRYFDRVRLFVMSYYLLFLKEVFVLVIRGCKMSFCFFFFQPFVNMNIQRRPKWLIPPEEV